MIAAEVPEDNPEKYDTRSDSINIQRRNLSFHDQFLTAWNNVKQRFGRTNHPANRLHFLIDHDAIDWCVDTRSLQSITCFSNLGLGINDLSLQLGELTIDLIKFICGQLHDFQARFTYSFLCARDGCQVRTQCAIDLRLCAL